MRTLAIFTASLVAVLGLSISSAQADPTLGLTWSGTTGTGTTGGTSIDASVGDTLTLTVTLFNDTLATTQFAPGVIWDSGGTTILDFLTTNEVLMTGMDAPFNDGPVVQSGAVEAAGGGYAQATLAQGALFGAGVAPGATTSPGNIVFVVTGTGSTVAASGLFVPAVDSLQPAGGSNYANATFGSASVNVVPEPGTAALLALGLGALTVAGRRRKA